MGNLLGAPVTDKETHTGETSSTESSPSLKWGMSSMQGWRVHMEDAHIAEGNLYAQLLLPSNNTTTNTTNNNQKIDLPGHALFAVFDGHGGTFSAEYSGRNFLRILSKQPPFIEYAQCYTTADLQKRLKLLEQALQQAFVETDYEIALAIRGQFHPQANQQYHHHHHHHHHHNTPKTATTSKDDSEDDTMTMRDAATRAAADHVNALDDDGDSGTTACVVLVTPDSFVCANAGDSRAIYSRSHNNNNKNNNKNTTDGGGRSAVALSYDHKPDDEPEERRIRAAGGYVAGGRVEGDLAVSRGLGDFRFKNMHTVLNNTQLFPNNDTNITTTTTDNMDKDDNDNDAAMTNDNDDNANTTNYALLPPGDQKVSPIPDIIVQARNNQLDEYIIVACDGIWDVLKNQECVQHVHRMIQEGEQNMGLICEELLDTCLDLGSKDNMTAIVVQLPGLQLRPGDGVMGRRRKRQPANADNDDESQREEDKVEDGDNKEQDGFSSEEEEGEDSGKTADMEQSSAS
ncbi:protein phosphatase 2C [Nitzschia inconspicua]|uniref:protein-serine/threonine phosphatase n=1 Tax=Nitzschia inconspicua TaxID=303405 RepID=A0A9K3KFU2_9STRA|nr:protein phosphatase 2C [Nitzschia inconspicua]